MGTLKGLFDLAAQGVILFTLLYIPFAFGYDYGYARARRQAERG